MNAYISAYNYHNIANMIQYDFHVRLSILFDM